MNENILESDFSKQFKKIFDVVNEIDDQYDNMIYHYSDHGSICSILDSQQLWVSKLTEMNDTSEWNYGIDLAREVINTGNYTCELMDIFECAEKRIRDKIHCLYTFSCSKNPQSRFLWEEYASSSGYALGMNSRMLEIILSKISRINDGDYLNWLYSISKGTVIYDLQVQKDIITRMLDALSEFVSKNRDDDAKQFYHFCVCLLDQLTKVCAFFKKPCYKKEEEYRFLFEGTERIEDIRIKGSKKQMIVVDFLGKQQWRNGLPLQEIVYSESAPLDLVTVHKKKVKHCPEVRLTKVEFNIL